MKNFAAVVFSAFLAFSSVFADGESRPAPTHSDVMVLKERIAKLEGELKQINSRYAAVVEQDTKTVKKLIMENRALRRQIVEIKRDRVSGALSKSGSSADESKVSASTADANAKAAAATLSESNRDYAAVSRELPSQKRVRMRRTDPVEVEARKREEAEAARMERLESSENANSEKSKSDNVWNHMFPF